MRLHFLILAILLFLVPQAQAETVSIGAAISLREALTEAAQAYESTSGDEVKLTFGSSGQTASQVRTGAPLDAFISAADKQVEDLVKAGLVDERTRRVIAGNSLVLIVAAESDDAPDSFDALAGPGVRRVATGAPRTVPAGLYARQVLEALNLLDRLAGRIVFGASVRQVLAYVERGEVDAGLVYATDARVAKDKVRVVATAPAGTHEPIVYPAIILRAARSAPAAERFLGFLESEQGQAILADHGFSPPPGKRAKPPATQSGEAR